MNPIATVAGLSLAFVATSATFAATIDVPGDYALIQDAINASDNGDVINIAAGTYNEYNINPDGKAITIQGTLDGNGTLATTIDAQQKGRVFAINSGEDDGTMIKDLVITGGLILSEDEIPEYGGGIYCANQSSPAIINCTISNNTADGGGGIDCEFSSNPTITDCTIEGNSAEFAGGLICLNSSPIISGCTIEYNSAEAGGGFACAVDSNPIFTNCTISNNTAQESGGIAIYNSSEPVFTDCTISNNTASNSDGGGISVSGQSFPMFTRCMIEDNSAASTGGGIYCFVGFPLLTDCTIDRNSAISAGGGLYCQGSYPLLIGCTVSDNTANKCGGIKSTVSSLGLENTTVCGNTVDQICGAYEDEGGNTVVDECPEECLGDLDSDGSVGVDDLLILLSEFGTDCSGGCVSDLDGNGEVTVDDLLSLLGAYGTSCP